MSEQWCVLV